jgi:hypothetical protein
LPIKVTERSSGSGNILFPKGPEIEAPSIFEVDLLPDGFFGVPRVRDLEELISELQHAANNPANLPA